MQLPVFLSPMQEPTVSRQRCHGGSDSLRRGALSCPAGRSDARAVSAGVRRCPRAQADREGLTHPPERVSPVQPTALAGTGHRACTRASRSPRKTLPTPAAPFERTEGDRPAERGRRAHEPGPRGPCRLHRSAARAPTPVWPDQLLPLGATPPRAGEERPRPALGSGGVPEGRSRGSRRGAEPGPRTRAAPKLLPGLTGPARTRERPRPTRLPARALPRATAAPGAGALGRGPCGAPGQGRGGEACRKRGGSAGASRVPDRRAPPPRGLARPREGRADRPALRASDGTGRRARRGGQRLPAGLPTRASAPRVAHRAPRHAPGAPLGAPTGGAEIPEQWIPRARAGGSAHAPDPAAAGRSAAAVRGTAVTASGGRREPGPPAPPQLLPQDHSRVGCSRPPATTPRPEESGSRSEAPAGWRARDERPEVTSAREPRGSGPVALETEPRLPSRARRPLPGPRAGRRAAGGRGPEAFGGARGYAAGSARAPARGGSLGQPPAGSRGPAPGPELSVRSPAQGPARSCRNTRSSSAESRQRQWKMVLELIQESRAGGWGPVQQLKAETRHYRAHSNEASFVSFVRSASGDAVRFATDPGEKDQGLSRVPATNTEAAPTLREGAPQRAPAQHPARPFHSVFQRGPPPGALPPPPSRLTPSPLAQHQPLAELRPRRRPAPVRSGAAPPALPGTRTGASRLSPALGFTWESPGTTTPAVAPRPPAHPASAALRPPRPQAGRCYAGLAGRPRGPDRGRAEDAPHCAPRILLRPPAGSRAARPVPSPTASLSAPAGSGWAATAAPGPTRGSPHAGRARAPVPGPARRRRPAGRRLAGLGSPAPPAGLRRAARRGL
ncbi:collagen alpha-1(I) chain-like [Mustela putorius furo]|uniref:Collagen alpha-1(I) chain-like n=1 Tax=Mustela putorius furo TaxID=9669 RepID=A0A8U0S332_MUSPF|nr:collagen alpha-1(I) chain-like [Mustela putorius furo]